MQTIFKTTKLNKIILRESIERGPTADLWCVPTVRDEVVKMQLARETEMEWLKRYEENQSMEL